MLDLAGGCLPPSATPGRIESPSNSSTRETGLEPTDFDQRGDSQKPVRLMAWSASAESSSRVFDCDTGEFFRQECPVKPTILERPPSNRCDALDGVVDDTEIACTATPFNPDQTVRIHLDRRLRSGKLAAGFVPHPDWATRVPMTSIAQTTMTASANRWSACGGARCMARSAKPLHCAQLTTAASVA